MIGRWNILDRGVRPLVVRLDGTFSLFDHREGRTDGRWVQVSDSCLSLFVDGPKRHTVHQMPDGRVFLSRYVQPGMDRTPELLFRSVLAFEGTWETPFRASPYTPPSPVQLSLGADRTFCADLGPDDDGATQVWSGIWARLDDDKDRRRDPVAMLDYVVWSVADGVRTMVSHNQTTARLLEDGSMKVGVLGEVFYPPPGMVRAEGDEPLATAEEPEVLVNAVVAEPEEEVEEPVPVPAAAQVRRGPPRRTPAARSTSERPDTIELPLVRPSADEEVEPVELATLVEGSVVPVARTTTDDGTELVVVVHADSDGVLRVAAVRAPDGSTSVPVVAGTAAAGATPVPPDETQVLPVATTTVDDGTQVVIVLYTDDDGEVQVGAVPTASPASAPALSPSHLNVAVAGLVV